MSDCDGLVGGRGAITLFAAVLASLGGLPSIFLLGGQITLPPTALTTFEARFSAAPDGSSPQPGTSSSPGTPMR